MKIIFATTNNRKLEDLNTVIKDENLDLEVASLTDIGWDRGEIEENGSTIKENSLIKAKAVLDFCREKKLSYPIVTDDAGLFVEALNGEPGVFTARYADQELTQNPELPKHYVLIKLLNNLQNVKNRNAEYRCAVTIMFADGTFEQFTEKTEGFISKQISQPIKKPYFYSLFIDKNSSTPFNQLSHEQLKNTYRFKALKTGLSHLNKQFTQSDKTLI